MCCREKNGLMASVVSVISGLKLSILVLAKSVDYEAIQKCQQTGQFSEIVRQFSVMSLIVHVCVFLETLNDCHIVWRV